MQAHLANQIDDSPFRNTEERGQHADGSTNMKELHTQYHKDVCTAKNAVHAEFLIGDELPFCQPLLC
jgi:hypothetical protein